MNKIIDMDSTSFLDANKEWLNLNSCQPMKSQSFQTINCSFDNFNRDDNPFRKFDGIALTDENSSENAGGGIVACFKNYS